MKTIRLGINIDHVATIRNARGGVHPDPIMAAKIAERSGADNITAHLREDRRHISENDIYRLINNIKIPLNFEMAATDEMLDLALKFLPYSCCIVPERRKEITTEGGLNLKKNFKKVELIIGKLKKEGILTSLFLDPNLEQINLAAQLNVDAIEIHTGTFCSFKDETDQEKEIVKIREASDNAYKLGLEVHAGHGLTFKNVGKISSIPEISELNIGHFIIGESIFNGLKPTILKMRQIIDNSRNNSI